MILYFSFVKQGAMCLRSIGFITCFMKICKWRELENRQSVAEVPLDISNRFRGLENPL